MDNSFTIIYQKLVRARSPEEVFGTFKSPDPQEQLSKLKSQYRYLIRQVHPDKNTSHSKEQHIASEATNILTEHYNTAKEAISNGTYGTSITKRYHHKDTEITFSVNDYDYNIFSDSVEGDFCQVYYGERSNAEGDIENICLKVVNDIDDNELMLNELQILRNIHHKSLPVYLDSFQIEDGRRANVLRRIEESYDLHAMRKYFPNGLPQEHSVWVMDRLLSVLGYLHINNAIHGSIEPGNIIVTPYNHNGLLIDFLLSIPDAHLKGAKYVGVNEFSAPEIESGAKPHPASDMYSLGKSMVYLLGGQDKTFPSGLDSRIVQFIQGFLHDDPSERRDDAWKAWHELKDLRVNLFGASSQFLELKIGGK